MNTYSNPGGFYIASQKYPALLEKLKVFHTAHLGVSIATSNVGKFNPPPFLESLQTTATVFYEHLFASGMTPT